MSVDEAGIRAVLDTIMDPCSVGMGCPLSLEAMGLVSRIGIGNDAITVMLRLTQPGCHFAALLQQEAEERIAAFAGTRAVHVEVTDDLTWSEADIAPAGRARLQAMREARQQRLRGVLGDENR